MSFSIIVAMDKNNCIGNNNKLLWQIPEDMAFFKETTTGHTILMGKKTFLSIGRPLPKRRNVVLTRDKAYTSYGVETVSSLEEALLLGAHDDEVFVIGGGEIYRQFLPHATKLYVTHIAETFSGDTFFPEIDSTLWEKTKSRSVEKSESSPPLLFALYERITPIL